ncbi:uncharacterized protein J4E88_004092 [Alternaria novae-zelandiae]|uniref:uncharacterized protein n=1 Tax=Alternaria novae-zelandiae TaxID=430562 RepID=UPI0020C3F832|nr:uncharacterized protein J4E88_004092 [Alternaria novae-zelandiae]XP_051323253.1 uncharacterized protein J4E85_008809 [Alternaria conjuncta]XP_051351576.1 uncharacterized protein J4E92_006483 [Alternaria infectoria]KAI4604660.1 hypothetical protein J4E80_010983 [Alternaria sp. BMP 0032]KAI4684651.1 hypothetical protein J4E88_004092 [Alternaria novae-zelandiae]KAI4921464.1 hypothetical protein J4E85_008809 [Alternaria conjuncta]KAI4925747.1 hypothetical protein J4E92_006483 [Alternaria infec
MKFIFATLIAVSSLLACTSNATAIPADQASVQTSADGMTIVELEVTDDRFPGITFKGTAKSIHEQIQAINPGASSDVNVENVVEKLGIEKPSTVSLFYPSLANNAF